MHNEIQMPQSFHHYYQNSLLFTLKLINKGLETQVSSTMLAKQASGFGFNTQECMKTKSICQTHKNKILCWLLVVHTLQMNL